MKFKIFYLNMFFLMLSAAITFGNTNSVEFPGKTKKLSHFEKLIKAKINRFKSCFDGEPANILYPGIRDKYVRDSVAQLKSGLESYNFSDPSVLLDPDSNPVALWHMVSRNNQDIYFARSDPDQPIKITRLTSAKGDSRWPYISGGPGKNLYVTWEDGRDGQKREIYFKYSSNGGESWAEDIRLTSHGQGAFNPVISAFKEIIVVAWEDNRGGIYGRSSFDSGKKWQPEVEFVDGRVGKPQLAGTQDKLWLVWEAYSENQEIIYIANSKDNGRSWSDPFKISEGSAQAGEPQVIALEGKAVCVVWRDSRHGESEVYFRSTTDGAAWSEETRITNDDVYSEYPSLISTGDSLRVMFHSPIVGVNTLCTMISKDNGKTWGDFMRLPVHEPNVEKIYFVTEYQNPWDSYLYAKHDVDIKINGHPVGSLKDTIPLGQYIFEVNPWILYYDLDGGDENKIEFFTKRLNPGHSLYNTNRKIIQSVSYQERLIVASSQAEADSIAQGLFPDNINHEYPDLGIYTNKVSGIPPDQSKSQKIELEVEVMNIGAGAANDVEVYIAWGSKGIDKRLGKEVIIPTIPSNSSKKVKLEFDHDGSFVQAAIVVSSIEKDFDMSNNYWRFSLGRPKTGSLYVGASKPVEISLIDYSKPKEVKKIAVNTFVEVPVGVYKVIAHYSKDRIRENVSAKGGEETIIHVSEFDRDSMKDDPMDHIRAMYDRIAEKYIKEKQWFKAVETYEEALGIYAGDGHFSHNLIATWDTWAKSYIKVKNWDSAMGVYQKALVHTTDQEHFKNNMGYIAQEWARDIYEKRGPEKAEWLLARVLKRYPDIEDIKEAAKGYVYRLIDKLEESDKFEKEAFIALDRCNNLIAGGDDEIKIARYIYDKVAQGFTKRKDWQGAIDIYNRALDKYPKDGHIENNAIVTWNDWAKTYIDKKQWKEAIKIYKQALQRFPDSFTLSNNLEYCEEKLKDEK